MLERDAAEANGNVKRMLSVCAEFERIARVVLDKAEREMRGRGKRKATALAAGNDSAAANAGSGTKKARDSGQAIKDSIGEALDEGKTLEQMQVETQAAYRRPVQTPSLRAASQAGSAAGTSPASWGNSPPGGQGPEYGNGPGPGGILGGTQWASGFGGNGYGSGMPATSGPSPNPVQQQQRAQQPNRALLSGNFPFTDPNPNPSPGMGPVPDFNDFDPSALDPSLQPANDPSRMQINGDPTGMNNGGLGVPFQQPFVPQDLWQMPMTLEWDWAEGLGLGSFTPGPVWEGVDGYGLGGVGTGMGTGGDGGGGNGRM